MMQFTQQRLKMNLDTGTDPGLSERSCPFAAKAGMNSDFNRPGPKGFQALQLGRSQRLLRLFATMGKRLRHTEQTPNIFIGIGRNPFVLPVSFSLCQIYGFVWLSPRPPPMVRPQNGSLSRSRLIRFTRNSSGRIVR